jgi:hypothetical protein
LQVAAQNEGRGSVATTGIAGFKSFVDDLLGSVATTFPRLKRRLNETGNNQGQAPQVGSWYIENLGCGRHISEMVIAPLRESPREGPQCARKPPFRCEREIALTA